MPACRRLPLGQLPDSPDDPAVAPTDVHLCKPDDELPPPDANPRTTHTPGFPVVLLLSNPARIGQARPQKTSLDSAPECGVIVA